MSWQDRPYYGSGGAAGGFGGRLMGASVVKCMMAINGVVFLLNEILSPSARGAFLSPWYWGRFSIERGIFGLQVWRWVTYQFLHHGFFHLLFNMIALYFFGPMMERWWGSRRFVWFYIVCGIAAALLYTVLSFVPGLLMVTSKTGLVGASGCVFGVLIGCAVLYPHQRVMLVFPPIPMTLRTMAFVFIGIAMLSLLAGSPNAGGEAAHLGGAAMGYFLVKNPKWLGLVDRPWFEQIQRAKTEREHKKQKDDQRYIDQILDKVRDKGLASLTAREKKALQRATDRQRRVG